MGVEAEFQACAKNLDESIKREMMRKGAMAVSYTHLTLPTT